MPSKPAAGFLVGFFGAAVATAVGFAVGGPVGAGVGFLAAERLAAANAKKLAKDYREKYGSDD